MSPDDVKPPPTHTEVVCTLSGLDGVQCMLEEVEGEEPQQLASSSGSDMEGLMMGHDGTLMGQLLHTAFLISPFALWGTSMVAMKGVVTHTSPLLLGSLRLLPAGLLLVAWAASTGRAQPKTLKAWAWILAFALADGACFQGFLAEGLTKTSAGLGSVIIDSQPLTVAVLASILFGERLNAVGVFGLVLGVLGLCMLELPGDSVSETVSLIASGAWRPELPGGLAGDGGLAGSGEFWMLLAAQSMALGTVMVRYVTKHVDPVIATGWHMVLGGIVLSAAAAAQGADGSFAFAPPAELVASFGEQLTHLSAEDWAAMAYVSVLGGAVSYGAFFYQASRGSLTALSSLTFLTPVFASLGGFYAFGEMLSPMQLLGGLVTLSAVWAINHKPAPPQPATTPATVRVEAPQPVQQSVRK
ncbi:hypothetical protein HXX76_000510 [Chlamydomonas incerta]|uniref:EamA domain-containing protein n=1 Tax=Chlamydomonas incerta TaxID=51695 RepID=A0A835WER8_CHLIN|nr:hypothetical protein HXX76_000510 [Chlamydomonas incerta]|eukprot:KAG2445906.1 hypothetical protein HXX76_000510 [Chlamydomonas incerta]